MLIRVFVGVLLLTGAIRAGAQAGYWVPTPGDTFQWDLEQPVDTSVPATVYDIDMFENSARVVATLHALGRHVICYIDIGSWERYRPDAAKYPPSILGKRYPHYPAERFVDIRALDVLRPILGARFDECRRKGFDAIEPDNIDTYQANTGFPLTAQDELRFIAWLISEAHARGLSIGQKNDPAQVGEVEQSFDWALLEECFYYTFCARFVPYVNDGKVVFDTEYTHHTTVRAFLRRDCPEDARRFGYVLIEKRLNLDAYRVTCSASYVKLP